MKQHIIRHFLILMGLLSILVISCKQSSGNMSEKEVITDYHTLQENDGKEVVVKGVYTTINPMPKVKLKSPLLLCGIRLEGDTLPRVFLEQPRDAGEQALYQHQLVTVKGTFYLRQPQKEGDPPYAAHFDGSWIYHITAIDTVDQ